MFMKSKEENDFFVFFPFIFIKVVTVWVVQNESKSGCLFEKGAFE